jgi:hypothetical protein
MTRAQAAVSNGVATMSKSAKASAKVFEQGRVSAEQLLSAVDPLFAAQLRYDKELAKAEQLMRSGTLTASEFAKVQGGLKVQLDAASVGFGGVGKGAGNSRIAMMEMQHVARGAADQFAAGAPISQIFAQHLGMVAQAGSFAQGSLGKFGAFLGGPWGIALTLATVLLTKLVLGHKDASESVDDLVDKMRKQHDEALSQEEANRIWAQSIEGVIEAQKKLNKELQDSLKVEALVGYQQLAQSRQNLGDLEKGLKNLQQQMRSAQGELKNAQALPSFGGDAGESAALASARLSAINAAQSKIEDLNKRIAEARKGIEATRTGIADAQFKIGRQVGEEAADQAKAFDTTIESQRALIENNKALAGSAGELETALALVKKAGDAAAGADVPTDNAAKRLMELVAALNSGKTAPAAFAVEVGKMAKALQAAADAAKDAAKQTAKIDPKAQFKASVIGAEGTGQNPQSSALGFGQFIRSTWITYFDRLFPDKATLTDDAKLAFRNVRSVAEAVIDKATEDYSKVLKNAGQQITAAGLYTVHVLGPAGAAKFLNAPATANTASIVGADVVAKNRSLLGGTVGQARAEIARRIGDSSGAVSSGTAAIEQALKQGLEQERKNRQRFFDDEQQTFAQIIEARKDQGLSASAIADVEHAAVEANRQKLEGDIQAKLASGEYTKDEAALRISLNNELAKLRDQTVDRRKAQTEYAERERQIENSSRETSGMVSAQMELLKAREGLVTTAKGRRAIEERLLDLQFAEEKRQLEAQIEEAARLRALADRTKSTQDIAAAERAEADAAVARTRLGSLPERQSIAQQENARQNAGPLQDYISKLPDSVAKFNEAVQTLEVQGINGLLDDITNLQGGFKSLLKSLLSTALQFAQGFGRLGLERGLAPLLGSLTGRGGVINLAGVPSFASSLGGGGGGVVDLTGAQFAGSFPHFARGGSMVLKGIPGIDRNVLSLNGLPIAKVSYGEPISISPRGSSSDGNGVRHAPVNMTVITPNADSFNRSGRQVVRQLRRTLR